MRFGRCVPSFVAAVALAVVVGACAPDGAHDGQGIEGKGGASGAAGDQGGGGGPAGSGGGNVGPGGSAGSVTGSGGQTGVAGTSGGGGTTGSGGSTGAGGGSGSAGADGTAGASGSTGTGGAGQAGRGGAGAGGAVSGRGGGAGVAGWGAVEVRAARRVAARRVAAARAPRCGALDAARPPTLTSGNRTIQSGGQSRSYILRIPDNYDNNRPYRLIFGYHWRGGTMQDVDGGGTSGAAWSYYGLRAQANNSAIFVAPQGIGNGWANSGGQDLTFTDDMVELIEGDLCVDTKQVFALGFSYGGGMSYALACARPAVFRAVAVYSGGVLSGCEGGTQPVAYIGIHGLGDGTLNISGGRSMRDRFVMNNGCTAQNPPEPRAGSLTHTCTTYQGCRPDIPSNGVRSTVVTRPASWTAAVTTAPGPGPRPRSGSFSRNSNRRLRPKVYGSTFHGG